jgi:hypothetical protein
MFASDALQSSRVGLLGDVHGNLRGLVSAADVLLGRGVRTLIQLGDFGASWRGMHWGRAVLEVQEAMGQRDQVLLFLDGDDDQHPVLPGSRSPAARFARPANMLHELGPNLYYMPRGSRGVFPSGATFAVLGGAASLDFEERGQGATWSREEVVNELDLEVLGDAAVDVLFGHDAPVGSPLVEAELRATAGYSTSRGRAYAAAGREMFQHGFLNVQPRLYVGGHLHAFIDDVAGFSRGSGRGGFGSRIVILDRLDGGGAAIAILDTSTLELEFLDQQGNTVPAVPNLWSLDASSGQWRVTTERAVHFLDLDARRWTRVEHHSAVQGAESARLHGFRDIEVGRHGGLSLEDAEGARPYRTSRILHIDRGEW